MNLILSTPMEVRLGIVAAAGICLGALVNLLSYRLAWSPLDVSPWSKPDPKAPPRKLSDRIPVVGWFGLRRETELHGRGFWITPLLVELATGIGLAALYWFEFGRFGMLPADAPRGAINDEIAAMLHGPYLAHAILVCLMLAASLIDIREKTIPDAITIPGTLIGLAFAFFLPKSLLSAELEGRKAMEWANMLPGEFLSMNIASPNDFPVGLTGGATAALAIALGCWWLWCVGLMPRVWYSRWGLAKAVKFFVGKLRRNLSTYLLFAAGVVGSGLIAFAWNLDGLRWQSLFTSLVGMAVGGGLIWMVRVIGAIVLGREAMGFGDVTLMAMIGAFVGWQACLVIFLLAPVAALVIGLIQLIVARDQEIPYGPFLCIATLATIVYWPTIWEAIFPYFHPGWLVPMVVGVCLVMLAVLLGISRTIRAAFGW